MFFKNFVICFSKKQCKLKVLLVLVLVLLASQIIGFFKVQYLQENARIVDISS